MIPNDKLQKLKNELNPKNEVHAGLLSVLNKMHVMKGEQGDPGYTPIKGKDYLTEADMTDMVSRIRSVVKDGKSITGMQGIQGNPGRDGINGITPVKGVHYWTPEDRTSIVLDALKHIKQPKDGISPKIEDIVSRVTNEIKKTPIELKDIKGAESLTNFLKMGGFRGGGLSSVAHDSTLTGDGTLGSPLHVVSSGTGTVTSVSVVTANGISGTVATATTTPAITLNITALDAAKIANGSVSNTEFQYLDGVTSSIQTQLDALVTSSTPASPDTSVQFNNGGVFGGMKLNYTESIPFLYLTVPDPVINNTQGNGLTITTASGTGTGGGGSFSLIAGNGGATNAQAGGISIGGGNAFGTGVPGSATIRGGSAGTVGTGGITDVVGGQGGATSGTGGEVGIVGGAALGGNSDGGDVFIGGGAKHGSGVKGHIKLFDTLISPNAVLELGLITSTDKTFTFPNITGTFVLSNVSSTDNAITRYDSTTGKLIQDSGLTISDITSNTITVNTPTIAGTPTNIYILPGKSSTNNTKGGDGVVFGGDGTGSGSGGAFIGVGGNADLTGTGGLTKIQGGNGGNTSGNGGIAAVYGGNGLASGSVGGDVQIFAGSGTTGGNVIIQTGNTIFGAILNTSSISSSNKTFTFPNTSGTLALVGVNSSKELFDHFASVGNVGTGEDDLYSDTLAAGQLATNGDKIEAQYGGTFVSSATATREIKIYFGGTMIFDTGTLTLSLSSAWTAYATFIRVSSSVIRYMVSFTTEGAALAAYTAVGELTGLTLANTQVIKITGESAGVGAATNDIVAMMGNVEFKPHA